MPDNEELKKQVASSLLVCIADIFKDKIERALKEYPEIKAVSKEERTKNNNFIVTLVVLRPKDSFGVLLIPFTGGGAKP